MRIRMKATVAGTEDGFTSRDYSKGQEYDVGPELAKSLLEAGLADRVADAPPVETKAPRSRARK